MCPHTWSRLSVPAAKRLKYSERRKGLRASSSAVSPSNPASGIVPSPPSPRATPVGSDYIRSGDSPWRSRDARRRASVSGRALERVGEADQRGLASCAAEKGQPDRRALGGGAGGGGGGGGARPGAARPPRPPREDPPVGGPPPPPRGA